MKNLFAQFNKSNDNNFDKFVIRKLSDDNSEIIDNLYNEGEQLKKEKAPLQWLSIASYFATVFGLVFVVSILLADDGFESALKTRGYFFYIGIGLFVVGLPVQIILRVKAKKSNSDPEVKEYTSKAKKAVKECEFELEIPDTAIDMDVLFAAMKKNKKGEEKLMQMALTQYINQDVKVFIEKDLLCFADTTMVVGVPLDSVKGIKMIKKRILLPQWNKSEPFKGPTYKTYKLKNVTRLGLILCKYYYEIDLDIDNESYYFLIPCYEKDSFLQVVGPEIPNIEQKLI